MMKISFSSVAITLLLFAMLFAPLITDYHPNFQKNIKITRFLPPLSSVEVLNLEDKNKTKNIFLEAKKRVVKYSVNNNIIYANSVKSKDSTVVVYSKMLLSKYEAKDVIYSNGTPLVTNKMFLFGTDELGRDIFSRIIYGARISLIVAFFTVILSLFIGLSLGFLSAHFGGIIDVILSRITDAFLTIPAIFFVIMILAFWGNSLFLVILVLAFSGWMSLFKIVKGEIISIKQKDYYITSKMLGLPLHKLVFKEISPKISTQIVASVVLQFSNVILAEASLSYLGLGSGLNYPSWGSMILSGQKYMASGGWQILFPALVLIFTILALNSFGEKLENEVNSLEEK